MQPLFGIGIGRMPEPAELEEADLEQPVEGGLEVARCPLRVIRGERRQELAVGQAGPARRRESHSMKGPRSRTVTIE